MKKIVIIGAGFAGLAALRRLQKLLGKELELVLVDNRITSDFLPLLPDCIGRGIDPQFLQYKVEDLCKRLNCVFINEAVNAIDLEKKQVMTATKNIAYDYLLIASGSETNFYGNDNIRQNAYKIDDAADIKKILEVIRARVFDHYIVCGGGYTGVEVATNLSLLLAKSKHLNRIMLLEKGTEILGNLPSWMREYAAMNLDRMKVMVFTATAVERIEGLKAHLTNGNSFDNSMVIWAAGVRTTAFIQQLPQEKNSQGRLKVDEYLRLQENCFVAGDSAYVQDKGSFLRMAVQFAICEGSTAAENIVNTIKGKPLVKYRPIDLGYIIPMANNYSCGTVFGTELIGRLPTLLHFFMCLYRCRGFKNKLGIVQNLIGRH